VEQFVVRGARMDLVDNFGKTARDYAPKARGSTQVVALPHVASNDIGEIFGMAIRVAEAPSNDPPQKRLRRIAPPAIEDAKPEVLLEKPIKMVSKVLARAGEFSVTEPKVTDVVRLRELELEFVADHASLFAHEEWHARHRHGDWCSLVNVIQDETEARGAIRSIALGSAPDHTTVKCVHEPSGQIVGYLHTTRSGSDLDVSHLKVHRAHQGRGLGGLLLAGALRYAIRVDHEVECLRLVVVQRNSRAISLYVALGFEEVRSMMKKMRGGPMIAWRRMARQVEEPLDALAAVWEARVRV
jgi:ribosomal protein S18 acetylase RimI-like enzyme